MFDVFFVQFVCVFFVLLVVTALVYLVLGGSVRRLVFIIFVKVAVFIVTLVVIFVLV